MKKVLACVIAFSLLAACGGNPASTSTEPTPTRVPTNNPSIGNMTRIVIDGDPSDWESHPVPFNDPTGDSSGNVDIKSVGAFANNKYLYVLVEVNGAIGSYVQLDLDINPHPETGLPDYMANSYPNNGDPIPHVIRIENGEFHQLENTSGEVAQGEAFELRIPLDLLAGIAIKDVAIRVMDGECCGDKWRSVDEAGPVEIFKTDEVEAPFVALTDLTASDSAFCSRAALERPDTFQPAAGIIVPEGYRAEYFIPPSGVNVPSDVVVLPNGDIIVASSRAGEVQKIGSDGTISTYARLNVYSLDTDSAGNLYGYNFPVGQIFKITEHSEGTPIARMPDTACESTLAVAPDGTIYIGFNQCSGQSMGESGIYKIPAGGGDPSLLVALQNEGASALDVDSSGTLFAVIGQTLNTIDTNNGNRSQIASLPEWGSFHGLVVTDEGTAYISSGDFNDSGSLFRIPANGQAEKLASIPDNGLEGLAVTQAGEVVGTQRAIGGVQAVGPDGSVRALVAPNGLVSPQALAFSPCGELLTVNDESGRLTLAYPNGRVIPFTRIISFQPPQTFLAFSPQGWYVTGESAPGFPSSVNRYLPNGPHETLASDIEWASGVTVAADGSIYVSATNDGKIFHILPDGTREVVAEGLQFPQALALGRDGFLYAVTGGQGFGDVFAIPTQGDAIVSIASNGKVAQLAQIRDAAEIAIGPDGLLYVAAGDSVVRLNAAGVAETFASGFKSARGVAFDIAGNLYVADDNGNNIVRIGGFPAASIRGRALDANGKPVAGAFVRVTQVHAPFAGQLTVAANDGTFVLPAVSGEYAVTVWAEGFQTATVSITDVDEEVEITLVK